MYPPTHTHFGGNTKLDLTFHLCSHADESEEEKAPAPKKATPAKPAVKVTPAKEESDEEEEDEGNNRFLLKHVSVV